MSWGSKLKGAIKGAGVGGAIGGMINPVLTLPGADLGALSGFKGSLGMDSLDGKSGNNVISNLTADQQRLMMAYINSILSGAGNNISGLQNIADNGFNPYDSVGGDALVAQMKSDIDMDRDNQISAIKGGAMNRFSTASNKLMGDAYTNARRQQTALDYENILKKAGFAQQNLDNKLGAIKDLSNLGLAFTGLNTIENRETYKPGLLDRAGQIANIAGQGASLAKLFMG